MKKITVNTIIALALGSMCLSSCIGSFSLTNNVLNWNKRATDNKFINELIFLVISPAYAVCSVADLFVLNTIEFWTGSNPMAHNVGKTIDVMGQDGKYYAVTYLKNGYEVKAPTGEITSFLYDKNTDSWSQVVDGKTVEMFRFNHDGTIKVNVNGKSMDVALDESGVYEVASAAGKSMLWASR